jgi:hypothetical protein
MFYTVCIVAMVVVGVVPLGLVALVWGGRLRVKVTPDSGQLDVVGRVDGRRDQPDPP